MLLSVMYWADSKTRVVGGEEVVDEEERFRLEAKRARRDGSGGVGGSDIIF